MNCDNLQFAEELSSPTGLIIGWLSMLECILCIVLSIIGFVFLSIYHCDDFINFTKRHGIEITDFAAECSSIQGSMIPETDFFPFSFDVYISCVAVLLVACVTIPAISVAIAIISCFAIKGVENVRGASDGTFQHKLTIDHILARSCSSEAIANLVYHFGDYIIRRRLV